MKQLFIILALLVSSPVWAGTPPTLVSHNASAYNTTGSKNITPTSGWQTGDLVVVTAVDEGSVTGSVINTPTATGLTFASVLSLSANSSTGPGAVAIFTATAGSTASNPITCDDSVTTHWGFTVYVFRNHGGAGNHNSAQSSSRTVSLTPTQADSAMVWTTSDWAAAAVQSASPTPTNADIAIQDGTGYTAYADELTDQTSAGAVSYGIAGAGTGPFAIAVLEIKGTGGGGGVVRHRAWVIQSQ